MTQKEKVKILNLIPPQDNIRKPKKEIFTNLKNYRTDL